MLYYSWMEMLVMYSQEGVLLLKLRFTSCTWCLTPIILHLGGRRKTVLDANLSYTVSSKPVNAIELSLSQNTQPTSQPTMSLHQGSVLHSKAWDSGLCTHSAIKPFLMARKQDVLIIHAKRPFSKTR